MSSKGLEIENTFDVRVIFIGVFSVLLSLLCVYLYYGERNNYAILFVSIPLIAISLFYFHEKPLYYFIGSLFVSVYLYLPLRLQVVNLIMLFSLFHFWVNRDSKVYNSFLLPKPVKFAGAMLIGAVFLSSLNSNHISPFSIYLALLFSLFMASSYLTFKYVTDSSSVYRALYSFSFFTACSGVLIIFQILWSGIYRSVGLAGFAIMDFTAIASLILIIGQFLMDKIDPKSLLLLLVIFIVMITTQSRFVWLGFIISFMYAVLLSFLKLKEKRTYIRNRVVLFVGLFLIVLGVVLSTGLGGLITERLGNVSTSVLQKEEGKALVANSLDTRALIWIVAMNTFLHNPVTGVGYQMFPIVSEKYNVLPIFLYDEFVKDLDAHTTYLNFLVDTGVIGLSCFLIYLITAFRFSFVSIRLSSTIMEKKTSIILNVLMFFIMIHSIYSGAFTFGQNAFSMHFIIGLNIANYVYMKNRANNEEKKASLLIQNQGWQS